MNEEVRKGTKVARKKQVMHGRSYGDEVGEHRRFSTRGRGEAMMNKRVEERGKSKGSRPVVGARLGKRSRKKECVAERTLIAVLDEGVWCEDNRRLSTPASATLLTSTLGPVHASLPMNTPSLYGRPTALCVAIVRARV